MQVACMRPHVQHSAPLTLKLAAVTGGGKAFL